MRSTVFKRLLVGMVLSLPLLVQPAQGGVYVAHGFYGRPHFYGHYGHFYGYPRYYYHGYHSFAFGFGAVYAPAPVYVAPPPVIYAPPPVVVAPPAVVAAPPPDATSPPPEAAEPAPAEQVPSEGCQQAPPAPPRPVFVETNRRYHRHGDNKGRVDWIEGLLNGVPIRYYYDDFGRVRKQEFID